MTVHLEYRSLSLEVTGTYSIQRDDESMFHQQPYELFEPDEILIEGTKIDLILFLSDDQFDEVCVQCASLAGEILHDKEFS